MLLYLCTGRSLHTKLKKPAVLVYLAEPMVQSRTNLYQCLKEIHEIEAATFHPHKWDNDDDVENKEPVSCSLYPFDILESELKNPVDTEVQIREMKTDSEYVFSMSSR